MKDELITHPTAILAKDKGFDWETEEFYTNPKKPHLTKGVEYMSDSYVRLWKWNSMPSNYPTEAKDVLCAAPTQSLLQRWLREVHGIVITVNISYAQSKLNLIEYNFEILYQNKLKTSYSTYALETFKTYEQALEHGLQEGLKLIQTT